MRVARLAVGPFGLAMLVLSASARAEETTARDVRIEAFQSSRRGDNYGIASFTLVNGGDRPISAIELGCWAGEDRERQTRVLAWPAKGLVPAHESAQFSNVNIGLVPLEAHPQCEVTAVQN